MKVWISRYALSKGIYQVEAQQGSNPSMVTVGSGIGTQYFHGEGRDWHLTREGAVARAEAMKFAKLASLRKQLRKLEQTTFEARL